MKSIGNNWGGELDSLSTRIDSKLSKSGDTMNGQLCIANTAITQLICDRIHSSTETQQTNIDIGNNIPNGTTGGNYGSLTLFGTGAYYTRLLAPNSSENRDMIIPDKSGIVATTDDVNTRVSKSGDDITGHLTMKGTDINLSTINSNSNDSGDIVFWYGNGNEKARIYVSDTYTEAKGPSYRVASSDGTFLHFGRLALVSEIVSTLKSSLTFVTKEISISTLAPGGEVFDRTYTWTDAGKSILALVGFSLAGDSYTRCTISKLQNTSNGNGTHTIYYAVRNTDTTQSTGNLTLIVKLVMISE